MAKKENPEEVARKQRKAELDVEFSQEELEEQMAETLAHLSTPCLVTVYIGTNPYLTEVEGADVEDTPDATFMGALEVELDRRGVRSLDTEQGWDCSTLPDKELDNLEQYLTDLWDGVKRGMLESIAQGWEKKRAAKQKAAD